MEESSDINQISKFNDAQLSIARLNDSWVLCKRMIRNGNLTAWKIELDNIWFELFPDVLRSQDKDKFLDTNKKLRINISKSKNRNELYFYLCRKHEFLRGLQDEAGKGGSYQEEDEYSFE